MVEEKKDLSERWWRIFERMVFFNLFLWRRLWSTLEEFVLIYIYYELEDEFFKGY